MNNQLDCFGQRSQARRGGTNKIFLLGIAKKFGKNTAGIMYPRDMDKINDFGSNAFTDSVIRKGIVCVIIEDA